MRNKGTFEFSGNLEVRKDGPLEAKSLATNYTDLVKEENWTDSNGVVWVYPGLNVTCKDRPGKIYQLASDDYTNEDNWIPIGDTSEISSKLQDFINSKGSANGIASLDEQGVVPSAQLPSYVDDVIDVYATYDKSAEGVLSNIQLFSNQEKTTPITPESGKIYIDVEGNYQFRWTGTQYATVGAPTVLGEVTGTAYDGGKGKALSDTINKMSGKVVVGPTIVTSSTNNVVIKYQTHFTSTNSNSEDSHTINAATTSQAGVMSAADKQKLDTINKMSGKVVVGPTIVTSSTNNVVIKYQTHFTSTNSNSEDSHTINAATTSQAGVMSAADKQKLDTINQAKTLSSATAGQWIRFAELSDSGYNSALVTIKEGTAGATFFFKCRSNGEVTVKVMDVTPNIYLTKIRVIKQNGQSNGYLEAYVNTASYSIAANISLSININLTDITVTSKIPGGYTSEEVSLV